MKLLLKACVVLAAVLFFAPSEAEAVPRFAARNGANCNLCHVSPAGGGMRNSYGRNVYAKFVLPWDANEAGAEPGVNPEWSPSDDKSIAVGGDLRMAGLWVDTEYRTDPSTGDTNFRLPTTASFFLMQTDVYAHVQMTSKFSTYLDYGVASGNLEAYGLLQSDKDHDAYVRFGSFLPTYGLKLPNHRTYIREDGLGIEPNLRETGVEMGIFPGRFGLIVGLVNGQNGSAGLNPTYQFATIGRADVRVLQGPVNLTLGGSWWYEPGGAPGGVLDVRDFATSDPRTFDTKLGGYALASAGKFTYTGEMDWRRVEDRAEGTEDLRLVNTNELSFLVRQGLDVQVTYEWMDPDTRLTPDTLSRAGAGIEFYPNAFTEVKLMGRHTFGDVETADDDPRTFFTAANSGTEELIVFLHVYL